MFASLDEKKGLGTSASGVGVGIRGNAVLHNELAAIAEKLTMPYSSFTLAKVKKEFGLSTLEAGRFLPQIDPIAQSSRLQAVLEDLPWAIAKRCCEAQIAVGSQKAKSEGIIYPVLQEVRRIVHQQVSLFSGRDFTVDVEKGLSGYVDYLLSRSQEQLEIEAPVVIVGEAKRDNLNEGLGQCIAEMVAAQLFNQANQLNIPTIYGAVSNGTQWRFLKFEGSTVAIDLMDYALPPVDQILGFLVWMVREG